MSFAAAACGSDAAEPADARARVDAIVPAIVDDGVGSLEVIGDGETWNSVSASIDALGEAFPAVPIGAVLMSEEDDGFPDEEPPPDGDEPIGAELARFFREVVFTDENYEGDGVYRLRGEDFCPADDLTGAPDAQCIADFDRAELRVRATLAGDDGLDITLLVGPDRAEPIAFELRTDSIAVVIDLAEVKQAIDHLASLAGEEIVLPETMEGTIALSLIRNAPRDFSVQAAVREAVTVAGDMPEGGELHFTTAAKDPVFELRADADARELSALIDLGRTTLSMPWDQIDSESLASGRFALDLGGLSGALALADGDRSLSITDLGLGDTTTTIKLDDQVLFAADLNKDAGRRFALHIEPAAEGLPTIRLEPSFALELDWFLQPLADAGDEIESHLLDETYSIAATGDGPTLQPIAADELSGTPGMLRVVSGQLAIASSAAAQSIRVDAGQCLVGDDLVDEGEHPILGTLAVIDCP